MILRLRLLAVVLLSSAAQGQTLVADINSSTVTEEYSSDPVHLVESGGFVYFSGEDTVHGRELWRTDGTEAGTELVVDLRTGAASSNPEHMVVLADGRIAFAATTLAFTRDLWITDGTAAGTSMLVDLDPTVGDAPSRLTPLGDGLVYFGEAVGRSLWFSDGTPGGAVTLLADLPGGQNEVTSGTATGSGGANSWTMQQMPEVNGTLYFAINGGSPNWSLWRTDGTVSGTAMVTAQSGGGFSDNEVEYLTAFDDAVWFTAGDGLSAGTKLWRSDGTAAGTVPFLDAVGAPAIFEPKLLKVAGNKLYFSGLVAGAGPELCVTDGTVAGTHLVADLNPGPIGSGLYELGTFGDRLVFRGQSIGLGAEPWISDGTAVGTYVLGDIDPGASLPKHFMEFGGKVYFQASRADVGYELWSSDGTPDSAELVSDLEPGVADSFPQKTFASSLGLFFSADLTGLDRELWITDGTSAGTRLVSEINVPPASASSSPGNFGALGDRLYFSADDGSTGRELWASDGTAQGTQLVADIMAGPEGVDPSAIRALGDLVVFGADVPGFGHEPWVSDGTAAGTQMLADIAPGLGDSQYVPLGVVGDRLLFTADDQATGAELWSTDGTPAGTQLLSDINPGSAGSSPAALGQLGDLLLFAATDGSTGVEPWITDGTAAGTSLLVDLRSGPASSSPEFGLTVGDRVYFAAIDSNSGAGVELWVTDGTVAGTQLAVDVQPGSFSSHPHPLVAIADRIYFSARDALSQRQLFVTDGSAPGTVKLTRVESDRTDGPITDQAVSAGEGVFFVVEEVYSEKKLWLTDGTLVGTKPYVTDGVTMTVLSLDLLEKPGLGTRALITLDDGVSGVELWVVGEDLLAPVQLADLNPGIAPSLPSGATLAGDLVFFAADDGVNGRELHALPLPDTGNWKLELIGVGCGASAGVVPTIDASGSATVGDAFKVALSDLPVAAPTTLFLGSGPAFLPLGAGCAILVADPLAVASGTSDGAGTFSVDLVVPAMGALAGVEVPFQGFVFDPGGAVLGLGALTPALSILLGS
ncbi:ELWxxDGT repeat protein [Engelhardtia mirabilis]|uniref:ELWxxDGT repeat protein n=1 Tax=Engelhardtia mirabilis TaxID=2528011 RepID=A0A518BG26_9BACT|nr:hypothetical protein Pla133_09950 [Planctomycetes bacterium Pla133]QDV00255.1 hypothetical protein Pla86_09940 [Planctomycetes bacterium Pla86]